MTTPPQSSTLRDPCAGFTIIEVLVSLAVLGLLLVVLSGGFQLVLKQTELEAGAGALRADASGREAVVRQLSAAMPVSFRRLDGAGVARGLVGDGDRVEFVTTAPLALGGLLVAALRLQTAPFGRGALVLAARPFDASDARSARAGPEDVWVLMSDVKSLRLRYFGSDAERSGSPSWRSEWHAAYLPDLVEVTVELDRAGVGLRSEVMVIAPARSTPRR